MQLQAEELQGLPANHPKLRQSKEGFPYRFQRELGPFTPRFSTSSLQNWETVHFCCVKPPSLWYGLTEALGSPYADHLSIRPPAHPSSGPPLYQTLCEDQQGPWVKAELPAALGNLRMEAKMDTWTHTPQQPGLQAGHARAEGIRERESALARKRIPEEVALSSQL